MPEPRALVVMLPGIGGSILAPPGALDKPIWSAGLRDVSLLRDPSRLSLGVHPDLAPVGLIPSRKPFPFWTAIHGYNDAFNNLVSGLEAGHSVDDGTPAGHNLDATVVAQGYDFRQSMATSAEFVAGRIYERVRHLWPAGSRARKVIIVAHSMGGLVARYWAANFDPENSCRAIITLGTPHRGAPKALDVWHHGPRVPLVGGHFPYALVRGPLTVLREWPGFADLLPTYPMIENVDGALQYAHELESVRTAAEQARTRHQQIRDGLHALETPPSTVYAFGFGHKTLRSAQWDGNSLTVGRGNPPLQNGSGGAWDAARGDGTVPAQSAVPAESGNNPVTDAERRASRHGPLSATDVVGIIKGFLDWHTLDAYRGDDEDLSLGLDLPDLVTAGSPIDLAAESRSMSGTAEVRDDLRVSVFPVDDTGTPHCRPIQRTHVAAVEPGHWRHTLAGLPPGMYDVRCRTAQEDLSTTAAIEVVDDVDLD